MSTDKETPKARIRARRVGLESLAECGQRLREGGLVAFPTETVYGLGASAMNEAACLGIFEAKERPLTDPLISHVTHADAAYNLWAATPDSLEGRVLRRLCRNFWPGPLTLVAKARPEVPPVVMAGTGFVACRSPNHVVARALIEAAGVPIAAPSANKFGHVSPTTADHVWDDLHGEDVWILETQTSENGDNKDDVDSGSCHVGVESSVVKLELLTHEENGNSGKVRLTMLRQGAVSVNQLELCLAEHGFDNTMIQVLSKFKNAVKDHVSTVSPGQNIRHYSPNVPSFMLSQDCISATSASGPAWNILHDAVIIDYGQQLLHWKHHAKAYRDLSEQNLSSEAAQQIFEILRWAELVPGASCILFPDLVSHDDDDALGLAVKDKLTRAASGKVIESILDVEIGLTGERANGGIDHSFTAAEPT